VTAILTRDRHRDDRRRALRPRPEPVPPRGRPSRCCCCRSTPARPAGPPASGPRPRRRRAAASQPHRVVHRPRPRRPRTGAGRGRGGAARRGRGRLSSTAPEAGDVSRWLVVMGSGETTPTMVSTHQRVLGSLGPARTRCCSTPRTASRRTPTSSPARTRSYFARNVGTPVTAVSLRSAEQPVARSARRSSSPASGRRTGCSPGRAARPTSRGSGSRPGCRRCCATGWRATARRCSRRRRRARSGR
jgi:hypothetical protein